LDGKFALQFQISDNFNLTNFQGTIFSGKYHFSKRDAIRLGISTDYTDEKNESDRNIDTLYTAHSQQDYSRFGVTVFSQYIRYLKVTREISFYGGTGLFLNYGKQTETRSDFLDTLVTRREVNVTNYGIGLDLLIGVEWWFIKSMSLSAEYGLNAFYHHSENKADEGQQKVSAKSHSFNISGSNVKFGITVYF
jgi:hypothetical protein